MDSHFFLDIDAAFRYIPNSRASAKNLVENLKICSARRGLWSLVPICHDPPYRQTNLSMLLTMCSVKALIHKIFEIWFGDVDGTQ